MSGSEGGSFRGRWPALLGRVGAIHLAAASLWAAAPAWVWEEQTPGYRSAPVRLVAEGKVGFRELAPEETGITFTNWLAQERSLTNQIYLNGSGVAAGDVDGDGWCDLYFGGLDGPNRLYRNLGNWKFDDITERAGVAGEGWDTAGVALVDIDGDGDLDLSLNTIGQGTHLLMNDGAAHFKAWTPVSGINEGMGGSSLAWADIEGDGDLDLYVANYRTTALRDQPNTRFRITMIDGKPEVILVNGRPVTHPALTNRYEVGPGGVILEQGETDVLYRNDGEGRFTPLSFTGGTFLDEDGEVLAKPLYDWALSVMFRDWNGDGAPDIYVCNDFDSPDRIWLNDGTGRFRAIAREAIRKTSIFSMGLDVADLDRDGFDDYFVADMLSPDHVRRQMQVGDMKPMAHPMGLIGNRPQYPRNTLYRNQGDGTYAEIAFYAGVEASDWTWNPLFVDVDLDGYEDLLIDNGFERDAQNKDISDRIAALKTQQNMTPVEQLRLRKLFPRLDTPNLAFWNRGDFRFEEVGARWGFDSKRLSQGMLLADLDNDGDQDVAASCLNEPALVCRNEGTGARLLVRLKGMAPNTRGIGAKVRVFGGPVDQSQEIGCGGRYLSSDDPARVFAAGHAAGLQVEVIWRSGRRSFVARAQPNRVYEIDESGAAPLIGPPRGLAQGLRAPVTRAPLFQEVALRQSEGGMEESFDDFAVQPLLPYQLSRLGPGLAWCDLDWDGWDDLVIGSGRGGRMTVHRNNGSGGFEKFPHALFQQAVTRDQTALAGVNGTLFVGLSNYRDGLAAGAAVRAFTVRSGSAGEVVPAWSASVGPIVLADFDGDGDLDLFAGGRAIPGQYPRAAASRFYRNDSGAYVVDAGNTAVVEKAGLVSGAVAVDLDGDGYPEMALACEWGPVRVLANSRGRFTEATEAWGLGSERGWWTGVAAGDFDGDGALDLAAGNWGSNTRAERFRREPLRVYHGDFDADGVYDVVEAHFDALMKGWVPDRGLAAMGRSMGFIRQRFSTFESYGRAHLPEILGAAFEGAGLLEATRLESTVFLNRREAKKFEVVTLPFEAQIAPVFGITVADVNGDGLEDLYLGQNLFAVHPDAARYDSGRGVWLHGDGKGGFSALSGDESGIKVYGEQRGAAVADFDRDGRVDLAVAQNGAATRLFRNVGGAPGLLVYLEGPAGNPQGIGAQIRLKHASGYGPVREVHAGSGYWSQDSPVMVLGGHGAATGVWVRWPGGQVSEEALEKGAQQVVVKMRR